VKKGLIFLLLIVLALASCAEPPATEADVEQLAVDAAVSYFTYDYLNLDTWMDPTGDNVNFNQSMQTDVLPALEPFMSRNQVRSTATLVSSSSYFSKDYDDGSRVIVWKIELNVEPPWPTDGPPYPFQAGTDQEIPWTQEGVTTVYAGSIYFDKLWSIALIPAHRIDEAIQSLSEHN
jgi:hypothetical protein